MKAISLLFHDVISNGQDDASGFIGSHAARYKLSLQEFELHLEAIAQSRAKPILVSELSNAENTHLPVLLTFDDGGSSAYNWIADAVERRGWRGHFFVTTNYIGSPGFLTKDQIRDLYLRGHLIGTHSCSHPTRMSHLTWNQMIEEWGTSVKIIADIIGEQVRIGSVPAGYFSTQVAKAASVCSIRTLFTSEPTIRPHQIGECMVLGRFTVLRGAAPRISKQLAGGKLMVRLQYWLTWNVKMIAKLLFGSAYLSFQKVIFEKDLLGSRRKSGPT